MLEVGEAADLVTLDEAGHVTRVMRAGEWVR
jgi:N-acetylglucosamine-6-phosphate deacetylase